MIQEGQSDLPRRCRKGFKCKNLECTYAHINGRAIDPVEAPGYLQLESMEAKQVEEFYRDVFELWSVSQRNEQSLIELENRVHSLKTSLELHKTVQRRSQALFQVLIVGLMDETYCNDVLES